MTDLKPSRDLLTFRDHARRMAAGTTRTEVTEAEAILWTQLADEIDQFISTRNDDAQGVLL